MNEDVSGIIIAGGVSSRIGADKALLRLQDKTVIGIVSDNLKKVFSELILIANHPELYSGLNIPLFRDIYEGKGPLAGIHSGLVNSKTELNFIISCDMPLVTPRFIEFLTSLKLMKTALVPLANKKLQTICAVYKKECAGVAGEILNDDSAGNFSVHRMLDLVEPEIFDAENEYPDYTKELFLSINTKKDYELVKKLYGPSISR